MSRSMPKCRLHVSLANIVYLDQTARSSLVLVHTACLYDEICPWRYRRHFQAIFFSDRRRVKCNTQGGQSRGLPDWVHGL